MATLASVVSWAAVPNATSYQITSLEADGSPHLGPWLDIGNVLSVGVEAFLPNSPVAGNDYQLHLRAIQTFPSGAVDIGPPSQITISLVSGLVPPVITVT